MRTSTIALTVALLLHATPALADDPIVAPLRCPTTMGPMKPNWQAVTLPAAHRGLWKVSADGGSTRYLWLAEQPADCRLLGKDGDRYQEVCVPLSIHRTAGGHSLTFVGDVHLTWSISLEASKPTRARVTHAGSGAMYFNGDVKLTRLDAAILEGKLDSGFALCELSAAGDGAQVRVLRGHPALGLEGATGRFVVASPWKTFGLQAKELAAGKQRAFVRLKRLRDGQSLQLAGAAQK